jgi:hypothetical protein
LRVHFIKEPKAAQLTRVHPFESGSGQSLCQSGQESLSIGCSVISLLLKLHDAVPDEPVPQGQRHIYGFGGIVLGLLMEVDDGSNQRVKVSTICCLHWFLPV